MFLASDIVYHVPLWSESVPAVLEAESSRGPDIPTFLSSFMSSWFLKERRNSAGAGDESASANSNVLLLTGIKLTMNDASWFANVPWRTLSGTGTIIFDEDTTTSGKLIFDQPALTDQNGPHEISVVKFTRLGNVGQLEPWKREGVNLEEVTQRLSEGGEGLRAEFSARVDPAGWSEKHRN